MENKLVVKHNTLIEARYNLSLNEQKVVLYAVTKLDREKDNFNFIEIDIAEFVGLLKTDGNRYDEIRDITERLRRKDITIDTPEKCYTAGWFSSVTFFKNTGVIKIRFDDDLIPHLLQLQKRFTRYELKNILNFKNKYSIRIYELMKQYEFLGKRKLDLEDLKQMLMIEDQYNRIYDFKLRILEPAKEEINEWTDIIVISEDIKKGRKVTGFMFTIINKDKDEESYIKYLNENYDIKNMKIAMGLCKENFSTSQVMKLYEKAVQKLPSGESKDIYEYVRLNYLEMIRKGKAINKFAYLMKSLEDDFAVASGQIIFDYYITK